MPLESALSCCDCPDDTYDEIEQAPEEALAKVRHRLRNNVQIF